MISVVRFLSLRVLRASGVAPILDLASDISASIEAEARRAAISLLGLGFCVGSGVMLIGASLAFLTFQIWWAASLSFALFIPAALFGWLFKRRLDETRRRIESLRLAAVAARAAGSVASGVSTLGSHALAIASSAASSASRAASASVKSARRLWPFARD